MAGVDPASSTDALVERQLQILTELAEIGLDIARGAATWTADDPRDRAQTYARVARAVRQTLMLQTRLVEQRPALIRAWADVATVKTEVRGAAVRRVVERAIRAEYDDEDDVVRLTVEASDRLRKENLDEPLPEGSFDDIVARICKDLGVEPPLPFWEKEGPVSNRREGEGTAEGEPGILRLPEEPAAVGFLQGRKPVPPIRGPSEPASFPPAPSP